MFEDIKKAIYFKQIEFKLIAIAIVSIIGASTLLDNIIDILGYGHYLKEGFQEDEVHIVLLFVFGVIVIPIVETFLYQDLFIKLLESLGIIRVFVIVLLCGILFAIFHYYNFIYAFSTFPAGAILGYSYLSLRKKKKSAFLNTCLIHIGLNLIAFLTFMFSN